ncbi:MAG: ATP-dependent DNA helicase RecG [Candidatus Cloacimonadota bacterium]|nr:ATP-dependent DNA helicase RecG [Candidatus Cloacimonadota bacterium]
MQALNKEIKYLKGVGEKRSRLLNKLNIYTIADLMEFFPRTYLNRKFKNQIAQLQPDEQAAVVGHIVSVEKRNMSKPSQLNVVISDGKSYLFCTWFRFGKWLPAKFEIGKKIWVSGKVSYFRGSPQIIHPDFEILEEENPHSFWNSRDILPVYPLTEGISMRQMRRLILNAFEIYADQIEETLPDYILERMKFLPRRISLQKIHFTQNPEEAEQIKIRYAFEELFFHQIMLARVKNYHNKKEYGIRFTLHKTHTTKLKKSLPFQMTTAQKRVIREIVNDMNSDKQMNRLLQGDVGSGKTIVTVFAMLLAIENGYQAIFMAPTEILAEQHFANIKSFLKDHEKINIALLKGGNYKGKKTIKEKIAAGGIDIIVGTHVLIQPEMKYYKVGFVAIDEQHRFGVEQRATLSQKNKHPDVMYLSATPIPRSLALTVYGDLDVSVLDELPPGRKDIKTIWRGSNKKKTVYKEVLQQLKSGKQVYIVCPLIEQSEKSELLAAETLYQEISDRIFPSYKSFLLHGKMKTAEKDKIMHDFKNTPASILVSTTVIEVGIDVANATVMIIEHAERFGLSQLHQLRGRVGRGADQSYCYLITYPPLSVVARERMETMVATNDGFVLAEKDLELRGPGDFFGTEQSGMPIFKHANLVRDQKLLKIARQIAFQVIKDDSELKNPCNKKLRKKYFAEFSEREQLFNF